MIKRATTIIIGIILLTCGCCNDYDCGPRFLKWEVNNMSPNNIKVIENGGYDIISDRQGGSIKFTCTDASAFYRIRIWEDATNTLLAEKPFESTENSFFYSCEWCSIDIQKNVVNIEFFQWENIEIPNSIRIDLDNLLTFSGFELFQSGK